MVEVVEASGLKGIEKSKIVSAIRKETGVSETYAYRLIDIAEQKKAIVRRKYDKLYVVPRNQEGFHQSSTSGNSVEEQVEFHLPPRPIRAVEVEESFNPAEARAASKHCLTAKRLS